MGYNKSKKIETCENEEKGQELFLININNNLYLHIVYWNEFLKHVLQKNNILIDYKDIVFEDDIIKIFNNEFFRTIDNTVIDKNKLESFLNK